MAKLYDAAGLPEKAEKARTCGTWLQFLAMRTGERQLYRANFCKQRLCPMCTARRAHRAAYLLSQVMDKVEREHEGARFLFLTLTVKNVRGDDLGDAITQLTTGWARLLKQRQIERSVTGWFRAIEITRHGTGAHIEYHPHIHAIIAVRGSYFARTASEYIPHKEWVERWKKALRVSYAPSVRIEITRDKQGRPAGYAAAVEAAKYVAKDSDYIDASLSDRDAAQIVKDYTAALHRRRLTAYGGWLKDAARELNALDLETVDPLEDGVPQKIRADVADWIEEYNFHLGAGDYVLTEKYINPMKITEN